MEKFDNNLNANQPVHSAKILSKFIENCSKQEYVWLKSKCLGENNCVSDSARMALLKLVQNGGLQVDQVLTDFITNISTTSNVTSLVKTIMNLLHLKLQTTRKGREPDTKPYEIAQHPIVKILQTDHQYCTQMAIYNEIVNCCDQNADFAVASNLLHNPLYLYCICCPTTKVELSLLTGKLWTYLVDFDEQFGTQFILKTCCWIQLTNNHVELLNQFVEWQLVSSQPSENTDIIILQQVLLVQNLVQTNGDCRRVIRTILLSLQDKEDFGFNNECLLMLSQCLVVCSPVYLQSLLNLCFYFATHKTCTPHSFLALKSMLLHWLANPSKLTQNALKIAEKIIKLPTPHPLTKTSPIDLEKCHYLIFCNPDLFFSILLQRVTANKIEEFLSECQQLPLLFLKNCFPFFCGLLISQQIHDESKLRVLKLILKCCCHFEELLPVVFTLILHEIANNRDNRVHFELLKALPLMVRAKENLVKVLATIQAISTQSNALSNFSLKLLYDAWKIDNKCYSTLEKVILQTPELLRSLDHWEQNISRAYILKELSEQRPELYGKDLVAHLSKILNCCTDNEGAIACAIAIEGIKNLCKAEVIDIVTTWATLSPKFKNDGRMAVVKSLCELIGEIPKLHYAEHYEKLNDEVVQYLWQHITDCVDEEITEAAADALAGFKLDLICMHMPEEFLEDGRSRANSAGEYVVPGKTWIKLMSTCKSRNTACNFLIKLATSEIDGYLKYVYQVKSQREPDNYSALPNHSIVRALGEFVKRNCSKIKTWINPPDETLYIDCLKILSREYPKPLPPLDWCFLQELIHVPSLRRYSLNLACQQAILSGSARRLVENYIVALTESIEIDSSMLIYDNLKHISNSIQPMILKPFFQNTFNVILKNNDYANFGKALENLKLVLADPNVQDVNKNVIEEIVGSIVLASPHTSKIFQECLSCVSLFSFDALGKISRFEDPHKTLDVIMIRSYIASNSLLWLNDIFEVAFANNVELSSYAQPIISALQTRSNHEDSPQWLNELFGQIQLKVAHRCAESEIEYFCDVLAMAVASFSGYLIGAVKWKYCFPAALAGLLDDPKWSVCTVQVLEWLLHMNTSETVPKDYQCIFGWTLCALRHHEEFAKSSRWINYFNCKLYDENKEMIRF